jgi:hypothetical protein
MKKTFFYVLLALIALTHIDAYSFNKTVQILVKGKIIDEYTGNPVEAQLEFRDQTGKKIRTKSNSLDGSWEQIFNSGDKLDLVVMNWDVARSISKLNVKDTSAYSEQKQDYYVRKFEQGKPIYKFNLFEPKLAKFVSNHNILLDSLKDVLLFSRNIKVELRINVRDSYSKTKVVVQPDKSSVKTKKKKNKKEPDMPLEPKITIKEPDMALVNSLLDLRFDELEAYVKNWVRFSDRIKVVVDNSTNVEPDGANLEKNFDYEVIVTELKNSLEK